MLIEHRVRLGDRQTGAALLVSLIFLVVLTLLGLQAMRGNVTQERMAGNMRERNLAFQAAEAALRLGESRSRGFNVDDDLLADPSEWRDADPLETFPNFDPSLANDPAYYVGPPQLVRVGIDDPKWLYLWPVTAVGFGGQDTSVVVLQSWVNPDDR